MSRSTSGTEDSEMGDFLTGFLTSTIKVDAGTILDYISKEYDPEDVFDTSDLRYWAISNGFTEDNG